MDEAKLNIEARIELNKLEFNLKQNPPETEPEGLGAETQ